MCMMLKVVAESDSKEANFHISTADAVAGRCHVETSKHCFQLFFGIVYLVRSHIVLKLKAERDV